MASLCFLQEAAVTTFKLKFWEWCSVAFPEAEGWDATWTILVYTQPSHDWIYRSCSMHPYYTL
jgi:hypothetical protein